ncbi:MAG: sulfatase [Cyclobacteriaceae bacterium]
MISIKSKHFSVSNILFLLTSALLFTACAQREKEVKKPNVIFLLTDDQRWDALGAAGNPIIQTPNLNHLAKNGMMFKNAYVTTSICCSSRASILSGQYMSRHKIDNFGTSFSPEAYDQTYPMILKQNGYKVGFIGKYGVGKPAEQPAQLYDYWACSKTGQPIYENVDENGNYIHYTDLVDGYIQEFLNQKDDKPFCLSVSFKSPHVQDADTIRQFIPNPRYDDYYKDDVIPVPETADPKYWESFPDFFRTDVNIARRRWNWRFSTPEKFQTSVKNYYRLITGVDDVVGNIMAKLIESGEADNTVIVFIGDNGFYLGEHGMAGKWYGHEESIRVPLIVYDPRNKEKMAKSFDQIALNIDIAPTILGLVGLDKPEKMQGVNLLDMVDTEKANRETFFYEHTFAATPRIPVVEGVVSKTVKYMNFTEHGYEELYDLKSDPLEKNNLAGNSEYSDLLEQKRKEYQKLKQEVL